MKAKRAGTVISCVFFISTLMILFISPQTIANVMTMTFEEFLGHDGTPIGSFYPGVHFEALTSGNDWLVSDITTGIYNASSWPSGQRWLSSEYSYWIYDYVAAWTGLVGDGGRIIFEDTGTVFVELGYCSEGQLILTAYDTQGNSIASDTGPANLRYKNGNESGPGTLRVNAPSGNFISYVIIHDSGNFWIVDNITIGTAIQFTKDDDLEDGQCASPDQAITYSICFDNTYGQTITDPFIIDWLPAGVDYNFILSLDPLVLDDNYNSEEHYYRWELDDIDPNDASCLTLDVTVNYNASPGGILHNVAELWGTIMVRDPNDPNIVYPEMRLVATAVKDTPVCCYMDMPETLYVDKNALQGANNGLDWPNAFLDLQSALEYARSQVCGEVQSIYCAQGTYSPGDNENDSFDLSDLSGIHLYAGFPTGGCDFSMRNPKRYQAILSGKIDDTHRNTTVLVMGNNTYLDGFTVTGASQEGYGIYGSGVDCSIVNCTIKENEDIGAYIENGNAEFRWCRFMNNKGDGVRHTGSGYTLTLENCWVRQSGQHGVYSLNSTPIILNSVLTESDMAMEGRAGLLMTNPADTPFLQNVTCAHNKTDGIALIGNRLPNIQNCIVYHNRGPALAGFSADQAASYSCIQDCNSINNNISLDPMFAYFDPNNVRIMADSPCHDSGLTLSENYSQKDMDDRDRVLGTAIDRGAYEIECSDTANSLDWNADGLVNLYEFNSFSKAWLTYDPNNPLCDPNNSYYVSDPNAPGYISQTDKERFNPVCDLNTDLAVDLLDLMLFCEDSPQVWLWRACWLTDEELDAMATGSEQLSALSSTMQTEAVSTAVQLFSATVAAVDVIGTEEVQAVPEAVIEVELSAQEQIAQLQDTIGFLEQIWLEEPDIQQQISSEDWQAFIDSVNQSLLELQTEVVQLE